MPCALRGAIPLAVLPRSQLALIATERIVVQIEDARVASALAAIVRTGARGRHRTRIVVVR